MLNFNDFEKTPSSRDRGDAELSFESTSTPIRRHPARPYASSLHSTNGSKVMWGLLVLDLAELNGQFKSLVGSSGHKKVQFGGRERRRKGRGRYRHKHGLRADRQFAQYKRAKYKGFQLLRSEAARANAEHGKTAGKSEKLAPIFHPLLHRSKKPR